MYYLYKIYNSNNIILEIDDKQLMILFFDRSVFCQIVTEKQNINIINHKVPQSK